MSTRSIKTIGIILVVFILLVLTINTIKSKCFPEESKTPEDTNVYLGEEVLFGKDYLIKVVGMSVDKIEIDENYDEDDELLSPYVLNLKINIRQVSNEKWGNLNFKSDMFTLKNVNLKSRSKMAIFFETLFEKTFELTLSMAIAGEVNIIESAVGFAQDYLTEVSENVKTETKLKPIKATKNQFEEFELSGIGDEREVAVSFPIKQEYIDSENTIVLTIDKANCVERRIFLVKRPEINN